MSKHANILLSLVLQLATSVFARAVLSRVSRRLPSYS